MNSETIAYFSMEIALHPAMPTYSGGLGILAGDTIRSAADLKVPIVAVSLLHRKGYFDQRLDESGWQTERQVEWPIDKYCQELPARAEVRIENRPVKIRAWRFTVKGGSGHEVPVLLLDTNLPENSLWDRQLTDVLYGGDDHYRLCQEVVLGIGGVRLLWALGFRNISKFHMNEGHASLLALELLDDVSRRWGGKSVTPEHIATVRQQCVFTTHTPVSAGHDRFSLEHVNRVLGRSDVFTLKEIFCCSGELNMTYLALNLSHYVNGVAKRHGDVSRQLLTPRDASHHYDIQSITNGVDAATWVSAPFAALFDDKLRGWREDNSVLRNVMRLPEDEIWNAHLTAKHALFAEIERRLHKDFDPERLTLGFARRATGYKRANLLLQDLRRLKSIGARRGLQVVYAGKAHPRDETGKQIIHEIFAQQAALLPEVHVIFLENYDWELARLLVAGVDVWLNTPQPPLEASGTSGMKAALNGVPSLSILDGWWLEGCIENVTGWAIGDDSTAVPGGDRTAHDANALYDKLERVVAPLFYDRHPEFVRIMRHAIALNGAHFNSQRMVQEYVTKAYFD